MAKNDGGTAFPGGCLPEHRDTPNGMSLRDYFAATALNGLLSDADSVTSLRQFYGRDHVTERAAAACYDFADAMLAAREK